MVDRLRRDVRVHARSRAARRRAARRRRRSSRRGPGRDLLHQRHDRLPQGRDDHPRELPVQRRERCPLRGSSASGPGLRTLISVPLFHVTGCNSQLLPALYERRRPRSIMPDRSTSAGSCARIEEERIDTLVTVPAIYWHALIASRPSPTCDISRVRSVSYGGAPIAPRPGGAAWPRRFPQARRGQRVRAHRDLVACPRSCRTSRRRARRLGRLRGAGRATSRVDEPDPQTGVGELLDPRAERRRRLLEQAGGHRRDVRRRLAAHAATRPRIDDEGLLYIVDRIKDMINRGGENVYCDRGRERARRRARASARSRSSACPTR